MVHFLFGALFGELDIYDDDPLNDPSRAERHLVAGRSPYRPSRADARWLQSQSSAPSVVAANTGQRHFGYGCSCRLLHRPATQMPCCDELCSVCSHFCAFGLGVSILPPQPGSPATGDCALINPRNARQLRAFCRLALRLWTPNSRNLSAKPSIVSG